MNGTARIVYDAKNVGPRVPYPNQVILVVYLPDGREFSIDIRDTTKCGKSSDGAYLVSA